VSRAIKVIHLMDVMLLQLLIIRLLLLATLHRVEQTLYVKNQMVLVLVHVSQNILAIRIPDVDQNV